MSSEAGANPAVRLSADPHHNAYTHATPTILGTLESQKAAIDASSFVLLVDDRVIYTGDADWYLYPGSSFRYQFVDDEGRDLTWEYRHSCNHERAFAEGRHEIRFTFRDTEGTSYGDDVSLAFFVDLTAPEVRFDGLDLFIEDRGSGAFLDPRVERRQASVCSAELDREFCREVTRVAEGWQVECENDQSPGLKVDVWLLTPAGEESHRQFVSTETVGWSVSTTQSGNMVKATLEPPGNRRRVDPDAAVQFVAYSRRLVLFGSDDDRSPPPDLVSVFRDHGTPFVFDQDRRQITVYVRGPADRAGNSHPPVFSDLLTADTGEPVGHGATPVGTTAGWVGIDRVEPPSSSPRTGGGTFERASAVQGAVPDSILSISDARVHPNPFNPFLQDAVISFDLSDPADVEIVAYDWTGEFVDTVFRGSKPQGPNTVDWGGQTEDGRKLGNGTYLIRVVARTQARSESVVLKLVVWNDG